MPSPVPGVTPVDYREDSSWLCRPGKAGNLCDGPLTATVLQADGTTHQTTLRPVPSLPLDCFYVYPTVSTDAGVNSDLEPNAAERSVVMAQAAPFMQSCKLYAPMYRQLTLTALSTGRFGDAQAGAMAYGDVVAAWHYYLANHNNGRKVVLIGHSQGAGVLKRLLAEYVDTDAGVRGRLAAAFLMGTAVRVPRGADVGGDFQNIPACRSAAQQGCVVSYASFNKSAPPPAASLFGRVAGSAEEALCVSPAALTTGALSMWLPASGFRLSTLSGAALALTPDSDYVVYEGLLAGECVQEGPFSYMAASLKSEGVAWGLTLSPYITGAVWGLHNLDVSLAMGNLIDLVRGYGK